MILQKLKYVDDSYSLSLRYYSIVSVLNNLKLTEREIQLIAHFSIGGNKKDYCKTHDTTPATVNNMISKLKKMYLLTKIDNVVVVNPIIQLNFKKDVKLEISLIYREATESDSKEFSD